MPSAPTRKATAGKKASSELYATCCESPMQSSARNSLKLRFSAANHSLELSRSGERGGWPTCACCSVAVDKAEAAERGFRLAFAPAPEDQPRGCADAAGDEESEGERARRHRRQVRAQLAGDVGGLSNAFAKILCGLRQLLAFRFELAPDVLGAARVSACCHCSSAPPSSASLPGWPARGQVAFPS